MHVLFRLRKNKRNAAAPAVIYCRITVNGKRTSSDFSTFIKVEPDRWDQHAQRVKGKSLSVQDDNTKLEQIRSKLRNIEMELSNRNKPVTAELVQSLYLGKHQIDATFLQVFDLFIEKQEKRIEIDIAKSTHQIYKVRRKNLALFLSSIKRPGLLPSEFSNRYAEDFELFLKSEKKCSNDYVMKNLQTIKQVLRFAIREEVIDRNPMEAFGFKFDNIKTHIFVTDEEMGRIAVHPHTSELLEKVATLFLFQCYTGFAYQDVETFHPDEHIKIAADGKAWVYKERVKTKQVAILPWYSKLFDPARLLLENCHGHLPRITNQVYNRTLKEMAQFVGIKKRITTHVGRKTAATRWLNSGIPEETVAKMLGHVSTRQLKTYAVVLEEKIAKDVEGLG